MYFGFLGNYFRVGFCGCPKSTEIDADWGEKKAEFYLEEEGTKPKKGLLG